MSHTSVGAASLDSPRADKLAVPTSSSHSNTPIDDALPI